MRLASQAQKVDFCQTEFVRYRQQSVQVKSLDLKLLLHSVRVLLCLPSTALRSMMERSSILAKRGRSRVKPVSWKTFA